MPDWMIESIQEIVSKMNKAERELFQVPNVQCLHKRPVLSLTYRRQIGAGRSALAFTSGSLEES